MTTPYKIDAIGLSTDQLTLEINKILELVTNRLDKIEGIRGEPRFYNTVMTQYDVVIDNGRKGIILKDQGDPPHYWRVTMNTNGTRNWSDLGGTYT
ncbi:MAG: hypothetical protein KJ556_20520 [Gammaproteobacteria bacterium]|nr:hypothetical protein [Gammaproteobacteria bacterium]